MPGFDGTGPRGMGPRTGGGRGFCSPVWPSARPYGWGNVPPAWSYRQAPYSPYGWSGAMPVYGVPYGPQITREQELESLKTQAGGIKAQLEEIESRIRDIEQTQE